MDKEHWKYIKRGLQYKIMQLLDKIILFSITINHANEKMDTFQNVFIRMLEPILCLTSVLKVLCDFLNLDGIVQNLALFKDCNHEKVFFSLSQIIQMNETTSRTLKTIKSGMSSREISES